MTFEIHPDVVSVDLSDIATHIAHDNVAAARRVLDAIDATLDQLNRHPLGGVAYRTRSRRLAGLRMLPSQVYPTYLIFHRAGPDFVRILYVVHSARHLPKFFAKHPRD